jgi:predicted nuclease of predicted toxin-antitoxin system
MIKFLADENIPSGVTKFLRDRGFDLKEAREAGIAGAPDDAIIGLARKEQRVLLTFDKHFANILVYPPNSHHGIIRIRIYPPLIDDILHALDQLMKKSDLHAIGGSLIVLEREGFRVRRGP